MSSRMALVTRFLRGASSACRRSTDTSSMRSSPLSCRAGRTVAACSGSLFDPSRKRGGDGAPLGRRRSRAVEEFRSRWSRRVSSGADAEACARARRPRRRCRRPFRSRRVSVVALVDRFFQRRRGSPRSLADVIATASARPSGAVGVGGRLEQHGDGWSRSSSCALRACLPARRSAPATLASNGNWCSSRVQKAWMVCTLRPPGVSSAMANSRRARAAARRPVVRSTIARIAASSASSSSAVHFAQRVEYVVRHVGGGRLGEGEAEDLRSVGAGEQQADHALRQHMGFARAGIGRRPRPTSRDRTPRAGAAAPRRE